MPLVSVTMMVSWNFDPAFTCWPITAVGHQAPAVRSAAARFHGRVSSTIVTGPISRTPEVQHLPYRALMRCEAAESSDRFSIGCGKCDLGCHPRLYVTDQAVDPEVHGLDLDMVGAGLDFA